MPAQPAWFHRLEEILEELREMEVSHLDRRAVEKLFGVGERRARQLMAGLPGLQAGNAFAADRLALLARFENTAAGSRFQWEISRRARLADDLERTRRQLAARRVRITAAAAPLRLPDLPAGIELTPGELRITFQSAEDLAARLFALSQAMANDWPSFASAVETRPSGERAERKQWERWDGRLSYPIFETRHLTSVTKYATRYLNSICISA